MSEHSPLPWEYDDLYKAHMIIHKEKGKMYIAANGDLICTARNKDDADFIIEACNNYPALKQENEQLKEALKQCIKWFKSMDSGMRDDGMAFIGRKFYERSVEPFEQLLKEE